MINNNRQALKYVVDRFKATVIREYKDEINDNYKGRTVGYIIELNEKRFFLRFRRKFMSFTDHYPQFPEGGIGFGFNESEIEWQIENNVWCMTVTLEGRVYVVNPQVVKDFCRKFNTIKRYFANEDVPDENEPILNVPFKIMINIYDYMKGVRESVLDWKNMNVGGRERMVDGQTELSKFRGVDNGQ